MAYISNQWLLPDPQRDKSHVPVEVVLLRDHTEGEWSREEKVLAAIRLTREDDGRYEVFCLRQSDVDFILTQLVEHASLEVQTSLLTALLMRQSNAGVFSALAGDFARRARGGAEPS